MKGKQFYTLDEVVTEIFGAKGTASRDEYDKGIELWCIGRKIQDTRKSKKLTQEELGDLMGLKRAQISRIENGKNITVKTVEKILSVLDAYEPSESLKEITNPVLLEKIRIAKEQYSRGEYTVVNLDEFRKRIKKRLLEL